MRWWRGHLISTCCFAGRWDGVATATKVSWAMERSLSVNGASWRPSREAAVRTIFSKLRVNAVVLCTVVVVSGKGRLSSFSPPLSQNLCSMLNMEARDDMVSGLIIISLTAGDPIEAMYDLQSLLIPESLPRSQNNISMRGFKTLNTRTLFRRNHFESSAGNSDGSIEVGCRLTTARDSFHFLGVFESNRDWRMTQASSASCFARFGSVLVLAEVKQPSMIGMTYSSQ